MFQKTVCLAIWFGCCFLIANLQANGDEPNKIKEWIEQLRNSNPGVRVQASAKLTEEGSLGSYAELALEPLRKCTQDADATVRLYAGFAFGRIEADSERSVAILTPLLADSDEHVRYSAEWSIAEIAKSVASREISQEKARKLFGVFETVENHMSRGAFQERHVLAVKLARTRLESRTQKAVVAPVQAEPRPPKEVPPTEKPAAVIAVLEPSIASHELAVSLSLYTANDVAGRLLIVDRMIGDSDFDDALRLAILEHELQSKESNVAFYAIARWRSAGQRLLSQLFMSLNETELDKPVAMAILQLLTPNEPSQLELLCKWASSVNKTEEVRIACLCAIQRTGQNPDVAKVFVTVAVPVLGDFLFESKESNAIRISGIEALAESAEQPTDCIADVAPSLF